jgi:hypothetical protein
MANDTKKCGFVKRVYEERGGKAEPSEVDVQAGRGARTLARNLTKGVTRGMTAASKPKGK